MPPQSVHLQRKFHKLEINPWFLINHLLISSGAVLATRVRQYTQYARGDISIQPERARTLHSARSCLVEILLASMSCSGRQPVPCGVHCRHSELPLPEANKQRFSITGTVRLAARHRLPVVFCHSLFRIPLSLFLLLSLSLTSNRLARQKR